MIFSTMKSFQDRLVLLKCADGEAIKAKVLFVDEEYQDVILNVVSTDKPGKWPSGNPSSDSVYAIPLSEIVTVEEVS